MTISISHKFRSQKADSTDASTIRPSNWNEDHNINMAGPAVLGRVNAGQGIAQEITLGTGLAFVSNQLSVSNIDAATFGGQAPAYYTNIPARLGFTPVISANPGRLQLHWGADSEPYIIVDNTFIQLGRRAVVNDAISTANNARDIANNAFNALRLAGRGTTNQPEVPGGSVMTGVQISGGNTLIILRYLQGFSPSRGWVGTTLD